MKHLMMTLLFLLMAGQVAAQQGLAVDELFSGKIVPKERMEETRVRGRMLADYKMSLFRSVKCKVSSAELAKINAAMKRDMESAGASTSMTYEKHGRTTTRMVQLGTTGKYYRYLCQKEVADGSQWLVTVIYIESTVNSLAELKKMFNNK
ncbi:MAG: hypothetical protein J5529_12285 [Prevotella sp.]|nr:hypothetical protein [Prevotella sp.]